MASRIVLLVALGVFAGCRSAPPEVSAPIATGQFPPVITGSILPASSEIVAIASLTLGDLLKRAFDANPRLAQAGWAVEAARGRALQAGLYPNPVMNITADEIADRTGPVGIWGAPYISQELVTHNKLGLSKAVACREVDQATLAAVAERLRVQQAVSQDYWDLIALKNRIAVLEECVERVSQSRDAMEKLNRTGEVARIAVVQLHVDLEKDRAELQAAMNALPAARRKLAASIGLPDFPLESVTGNFDGDLPACDLDALRTTMLAAHPDLQSAQVGIERARLAVQRAEAEAKPNITLSAGYTYQGQNRSNDVGAGVALPLPVWNRNQGNIQAARAQLAVAQHEVARIGNELEGRLATAFATYTAARARAAYYRDAVLPKALEAEQLAVKGRELGQLDYLKVLEAQRGLSNARLELLKSQAECRRAAAELLAMTLQDGVCD